LDGSGIGIFMVEPGAFVNQQGELCLFFPDCPSLIAPLLLARLKKTGFSRCRAMTRHGGIVLSARR
jgi:ribosomal protein L34